LLCTIGCCCIVVVVVVVVQASVSPPTQDFFLHQLNEFSLVKLHLNNIVVIDVAAADVVVVYILFDLRNNGAD
jgi:hypothetical protein